MGVEKILRVGFHQQITPTFFSISSRPASFLQIMFGRPWHMKMNHATHVRLVQTHPKRDRRHRDGSGTHHKTRLHSSSIGGGHASMVGFGVVTTPDQKIRQHFAVTTSKDIDNDAVGFFLVDPAPAPTPVPPTVSTKEFQIQYFFQSRVSIFGFEDT